MQIDLSLEDIGRHIAQDQIDNGLFDAVFLENCRASLYFYMGVINERPKG